MLFFKRDAHWQQKCFCNRMEIVITMTFRDEFISPKAKIILCCCCSIIWLDIWELTLHRGNTLDPTQAKRRPLAFPACQWTPQALIHNQDKKTFHIYNLGLVAVGDLVSCMLLGLGCLLTIISVQQSWLPCWLFTQTDCHCPNVYTIKW